MLRYNRKYKIYSIEDNSLVDVSYLFRRVVVKLMSFCGDVLEKRQDKTLVTHCHTYIDTFIDDFRLAWHKVFMLIICS